MSADIIHKGHLKIIKIASKRGIVIIGLLTDKAISTYKRIPIMNFKERKLIISNIKGVKKVIAQKTLSYESNLRKIKPDYVVHGDDWKNGPQRETRKRVIECLKKWGGKLIEPRYTEGISSTKLQAALRKELKN